MHRRTSTGFASTDHASSVYTLCWDCLYPAFNAMSPWACTMPHKVQFDLNILVELFSQSGARNGRTNLSEGVLED